MALVESTRRFRIKKTDIWNSFANEYCEIPEGSVPYVLAEQAYTNWVTKIWKPSSKPSLPLSLDEIEEDGGWTWFELLHLLGAQTTEGTLW